MFKFIFEILTDPLGLPIEWYWEYLILAVIGVVAYAVAYRCVGDMYSGGMIDGSTSGSFFHWLIRLILFVALWAVTYGIIAAVKWLTDNWVYHGWSCRCCGYRHSYCDNYPQTQK